MSTHMPSIALLALLIVLQAFDYYTTTTILANGGVEINPVMRWLMEQLGVHEALALKGFLVCGFAFLVLFETPWAIAAMDAVFVAVIVFNYRSMPQ